MYIYTYMNEYIYNGVYIQWSVYSGVYTVGAWDEEITQCIPSTLSVLEELLLQEIDHVTRRCSHALLYIICIVGS